MARSSGSFAQQFPHSAHGTSIPGPKPTMASPMPMPMPMPMLCRVWRFSRQPAEVRLKPAAVVPVPASPRSCPSPHRQTLGVGWAAAARYPCRQSWPRLDPLEGGRSPLSRGSPWRRTSFCTRPSYPRAWERESPNRERVLLSLGRSGKMLACRQNVVESLVAGEGASTPTKFLPKEGYSAVVIEHLRDRLVFGRPRNTLEARRRERAGG